MTSDTCFYCHGPVQMRTETMESTHFGRTVSYSVEATHCAACDESMLTSDQFDRAQAALADALADAMEDDDA